MATNIVSTIYNKTKCVDNAIIYKTLEHVALRTNACHKVNKQLISAGIIFVNKQKIYGRDKQETPRQYN